MPKSRHHRPGRRPAARPTEEIIFQSAPKVNIDEIRQEQAEMIERCGFYIQEVLPDRFPGFAYTVGLCKHDLPEIVCIGLPPKVAPVLLNTLAERLLANPAEMPKTGELIERVANMPVKLEELDPDMAVHIAFGALEYADRIDAPLDFLQLVYPDQVGLFPDQEGCDPGIRQLQDAACFADDREGQGGNLLLH